jgi:hypothetical protein
MLSNQCTRAENGDCAAVDPAARAWAWTSVTADSSKRREKLVVLNALRFIIVAPLQFAV